MTTQVDRDAAHLSQPCSCLPARPCACPAWALSAAISPRAVVRAPARGGDGQLSATYHRAPRLDRPAPGVPWALHLTDAAGAFRLLGFDLDAHRPGQRAAAAADAGHLAGVLDGVGIAHVVCASGPSGGRHVWVALDHGADAGQVASLARLAAHVLPTLDTSPLCNAATGCLRPPGSPHRDGGASTVIAGDVAVLAAPSTSAEQVRALHGALAALVQQAGLSEPAAMVALGVVLDEGGHPHLPGTRRALSAGAAAAAARCGPDASATAFAVLTGAARARWRHGDVATVLADAPGLEHLRTTSSPAGRIPRPAYGPASPAAVLARQWARAVAAVATSPQTAGADPTFDARAGQIAALVAAVRDAAAACPARWAHGGGPADWRALEVLSLITLQAVAPQVDVALRRLGELCGFSYECARTALERLAADGWVRCVRPAAGRRAATWAITHPMTAAVEAVVEAVVPTAAALARGAQPELTQAVPRPSTTPSCSTPVASAPTIEVGVAERTALLSVITTTVTSFAHDVFTHRALGLSAGNLYAATSATRATPTADLVKITGAARDDATATLERLADHGLLVSDGATWWRPTGADRRDAVAATLPDNASGPVTGTLARRAESHRLDQQTFDWWCAERAWQQAPRRPGAKRRPMRGQLALVAEEGARVYGPFPRRPNGTPNFTQARDTLAKDEAARDVHALDLATRHAPAPIPAAA